MRSKVFAAILTCFLIAASCTSDDDEPQAERPQAEGSPSPSPTQTVGAVDAFDRAGDCDGLGELHGPQLSFVSEDQLFVARRTGTIARCVLTIPGPSDLEWGPEGDRAHFGDLRRFDGGQVISPPEEATSTAWSRPSGQSIVYVSEGRLMKVDAFGEEPFEISFLSDHDEVVYHPAGTHVAVTGTADDGTYGLWLATNIGEEPQLLAIGEDARRIFSLSFAHDGTTLYYAAEHDDRYDVHSLRLALQDEEGKVRDAELGTLDSAPTEMADVVATEFSGEAVAYTVGSCEEQKTTRVWNGSVTEVGGELAGLSTEPIGWLPGGDLLLLARDAGCDGPGTLYAWRSAVATRLASEVTAAGVRALLPPPPDPPGSDQQVIA